MFVAFENRISRYSQLIPSLLSDIFPLISQILLFGTYSFHLSFKWYGTTVIFHIITLINSLRLKKTKKTKKKKQLTRRNKRQQRTLVTLTVHLRRHGVSTVPVHYLVITISISSNVIVLLTERNEVSKRKHGKFNIAI